MNARARLIVQEPDDRRDMFGGPIVVLDVDLAEYVRGLLATTLGRETAGRVTIGIRLDVPIALAPSEWLTLERPT